MPDEDAGRLKPFGRQIIGAVDASEHGDVDDAVHDAALVFQLLVFDGGVRRQIGLYGVADHIADAAHDGVRIRDAHGNPLVVDADVQIASVGIGEGDDFTFHRVDKLSFELYCGAFP